MPAAKAMKVELHIRASYVVYSETTGSQTSMHCDRKETARDHRPAYSHRVFHLLFSPTLLLRYEK